jgi:hypothetical protein
MSCSRVALVAGCPRPGAGATPTAATSTPAVTPRRPGLVRAAGVPALLLAAAAALAANPVLAADDAGTGAPGVNPKDLVTKVDLIFKRDLFEGGVAINSWTFKYDRPIGPQLGIAVELPYAQFRTAGGVVDGAAESKFKLRHVSTRGRLSWVAGGEVVLPTESDPLLGSGTWQVNPSAGAVYAVSPTVFAFAGVQRFQSVDRDPGRAPVRQNQARLLAARVSQSGWWLLADGKYTRDLVADADLLDLEFEVGRMLGPATALSVRAATSGLDSTRTSGVVVNLRFLL